MSTGEARKQYEQARERGRQARSGGKGRTNYPYRGNTQLVRDLQEEFRQGWDERDREIGSR